MQKLKIETFLWEYTHYLLKAASGILLVASTSMLLSPEQAPVATVGRLSNWRCQNKQVSYDFPIGAKLYEAYRGARSILTERGKKHRSFDGKEKTFYTSRRCGSSGIEARPASPPAGSCGSPTLSSDAPPLRRPPPYTCLGGPPPSRSGDIPRPHLTQPNRDERSGKLWSNHET